MTEFKMTPALQDKIIDFYFRDRNFVPSGTYMAYKVHFETWLRKYKITTDNKNFIYADSPEALTAFLLRL